MSEKQINESYDRVSAIANKMGRNTVKSKVIHALYHEPSDRQYQKRREFVDRIEDFKKFKDPSMNQPNKESINKSWDLIYPKTTMYCCSIRLYYEQMQELMGVYYTPEIADYWLKDQEKKGCIVINRDIYPYKGITKITTTNEDIPFTIIFDEEFQSFLKKAFQRKTNYQERGFKLKLALFLGIGIVAFLLL